MAGCSNCENVSRKELERSCCALKEQMCRSENAGNPVQLVQFAEHAVKVNYIFKRYSTDLIASYKQSGHVDIAVDCLQLYFSLNPPVNQFLIRAHLCKALVASPLNCSERVSLALSIYYISPLITAFIT